MTRWKACTLMAMVAVFICVSEAQQIDSKISKPSDEEKLLDCSELTDVSDMSRCVSRRLTEMKKKTPSSYGYPYRIAPTLSPSLVQDPQPDRRTDRFSGQKRIQGYNVPQYRNFLDLDTPLRSRVAEYRSLYDGYAVPVLVRPSVDEPYRNLLEDDYYPKPSKTRPRKQLYGKPQGYGERYAKRRPHDYNNVHDYKYNDYYRDGQKDYYVPENSPIVGDIRRSLLDYTGASDLMEDEPEYNIRSHRIKEMGNDYYPFRRSDVVRDLEVNESTQRRSLRNNQ